nr:6-methylsalicylic acid decarboxylase [Quercus suber]
MSGKIDVHTHAVPSFFEHHLESLKASGVPAVKWSIDATREINSKLGVSTSILSLSAPGAEIKSDRAEARQVAREYNEWASTLKRDDPSHFGFFAAVPSLTDTDGCLTEISYALDELDADGVCVFTTYDGKYLGDRAFDTIWSELDRRQTVVLIHPIQAAGSVPISPLMMPPTFDFPHETGRTAAHMIMSGTKRRYHNVKIILSHAGGTLPYLIERLAQLNATLFAAQLEEGSPKTVEDIVDDAKSFYFDLALSGTHNILDLLLRWAPEKVLYGSDFPYCTVEAEYNTQKLETYPLSEETRASINRNTALELFPRLKYPPSFSERLQHFIDRLASLMPSSTVDVRRPLAKECFTLNETLLTGCSVQFSRAYAINDSHRDIVLLGQSSMVFKREKMHRLLPGDELFSDVTWRPVFVDPAAPTPRLLMLRVWQVSLAGDVSIKHTADVRRTLCPYIVLRA